MTPEQAFEAFNAAISAAPEGALAADTPPILFICGAPRSGTTFVSQCLAHGGDMGSITNLVARFATNPTLGIRLAQALDLRPTFSGQSDYGRTAGLGGLHEFGRGWLRILGLDDLMQPENTPPLPAQAAHQIAKIARAWEKPVVLKSFAYLWFMEDLARVLPGSLWLHLKRDPAANANSLIGLYRTRAAGAQPNKWESAVCRATVTRMRGKPLEQRTLAQVEDLNEHIAGALRGLPAERRMTVQFETFMSSPRDSTKAVLRHFSLRPSAAHLKDLPK